MSAAPEHLKPLPDPPALAAEHGLLTLIKARFLRWRDGMLLQRRFQQWALSFPFTRPIARRYAVRLFDLCAGFIYSQVLLAAVRLDLFEMLSEGPLSLADMAKRLRMRTDALERLLQAAVALDLLEQRSAHAGVETTYGLGMLGASVLTSPGVRAMIQHHALFYHDMADPVALLRGRGSDRAMASYWAYATSQAPRELHDVAVGEYSALMAASQPMVADEILACYNFSKHKHLLDIGGGEGVFLSEVGARHPKLRLTLMDLPAVAKRAAQRFERLGLGARADCIGGSFLSDPIPQGADLVSLVRVAHDHDDEFVMQLFRRIRQVMAPGAKLLLAEPMAQTKGAMPVADAYFAMYLWAMGSGRSRRADELMTMLNDAGFRTTRLLRQAMPLQVRVILAEA